MNIRVLENQILNAAIDSGDPAFFRKLGVDRTWFPTLPQAHDVFTHHCDTYGEVPSVTTMEEAQVDDGRGGRVTLKAAGFDSSPAYDSSDVMRRKMAEMLAVRDIESRLASIDSSNMDARTLLAKIAAITQDVERKWDIYDKGGIDVTRSGDLVLSEYEARKDGRVGVKIPTPYATLNAALGGGMETGDEVALMAFTNRGKTFEACHFGETANHFGYKVVHASLEMSRARVLFRWHVLRAYREGRRLSNRGLLAGRLDEATEAELVEYLRQYGEEATAAGYILKIREDYPKGLTLAQVERDIIENDLSGGLYILDQLNLTDYHSLPGGMKEFHRKLVGIFQKHNVVGLVMMQANGESEKKKAKDDGGGRILKAPDLSAYSETIATIQDARTMLTFDSLDYRAVLSLEKATDGGVGTQVELYWNPDMGEICEMDEERERRLEAIGAEKMF